MLRRIPVADIEAMRKAQGERIQRLRSKIWAEMAGRPDPADPARTIPSPIPVNDLVTTALRIEAREAALHGLDAPAKQQVLAATATFSQPISDEELDIQLGAAD